MYIFEKIGHIFRAIAITYFSVCAILMLLGVLGVESVFAISPKVVSQTMIGILVIPFMIIGLFKGDSSSNIKKSYNDRKRNGNYLDINSALSHGMSTDDIIKYNTGDYDTHMKYRQKAMHINKSDEFNIG